MLLYVKYSSNTERLREREGGGDIVQADGRGEKDPNKTPEKILGLFLVGLDASLSREKLKTTLVLWRTLGSCASQQAGGTCKRARYF